jgi:hypothetical protein
MAEAMSGESAARRKKRQDKAWAALKVECRLAGFNADMLDAWDAHYNFLGQYRKPIEVGEDLKEARRKYTTKILRDTLTRHLERQNDQR